MADPFIGEIRIFGFNYAPEHWAFCDGQILQINQNQTLFALLGATFGGDGRTTFALPDLRGRIPVHASSTYHRGQKFGTETVTLTADQIPTHTHTLNAIDAEGNSSDPTGRALCKPVHDSDPLNMYGNPFDDVKINPSSITTAGGNQAHTNIQPGLVLNFCIALQGVYPPRD